MLKRFKGVRGGFADLFAMLRESGHAKWLPLAAAIALPAFMMLLVALTFHADKVYRQPEVTYVTSFAPGRSRAEVAAQQAKDLPAEKAKRDAEAAAAEKERQTYRRIGHALGMQVDER